MQVYKASYKHTSFPHLFSCVYVKLVIHSPVAGQGLPGGNDLMPPFSSTGCSILLPS